MRLGFFVLMFFCTSLLYSSNGMQQQKISSKVQSATETSVQSTAQIKNKVTDTASTNLSGQKTYEQYCIVCHRDGLAGAPKFKNKEDWGLRLSGRTLDDLLLSSIKGLNAMPTKGTCFDCSDEDLKAAITYMLPKS